MKRPPLRLLEKDGGKQKDYSEVRARQRLNELSRLVRYRRDNGYDIGPDAAWSVVLSDIALARRRLWTKDWGSSHHHGLGETTAAEMRTQVENYFWRIGLGVMVQDSIARAILGEVWPRLTPDPHIILPAAYVGEILEVTADEREACRLRTIDDVEEGREGRRQRSARQRERERRAAAGATPREQSLTAQCPWEALGISRATYYRRQKA